MNIGMLWYDNSPAPLADKLKKAAAYYQAKYGRKPDVCYVAPGTAPDGTTVHDLTLRVSSGISKNNFWMGVDHA